MVTSAVVGGSLVAFVTLPVVGLLLHRWFLRGERLDRDERRANLPESANDAYPSRTVPGGESRERR